jgi:hypothetical protein
MMTFILIASFFLIAFVGLLRYDVHKHKYAQPKKDDAQSLSDSSDHADPKIQSDHNEDK